MNNSHPLGLMIRNLELRAPLSQAATKAILALPHTVRRVAQDDYIVREGELPTKCGVLVSGFAYRQKITRAGGRHIVAIHISGDALDFQNLHLEVADHSVQMLTDGEVAFVPQEALLALTRSDVEVAEAIFAKTLVGASIFREWVVNVGSRRARARIAHLLCEIGLRLETMGLAQKHGYQLPLTQEQLGDAVGLTPVHVNRTLKALSAEGLITRDNRNISFPNWETIRAEGDFNERYLHIQRKGSVE